MLCDVLRERADWYLVWVFLHVLDGLQDPQRLLHIPAKGQVVDGCVLDDALHTQHKILDLRERASNLHF